MNAQQFLAEFGHIANAPGGIERLRELIYQFAVTGRLVPQQPEEGDASLALERIAHVRKQLIREKRFKRTAKLESEHLVVPAIALPESWRWSRLLDLGEINPRNEAKEDARATFVPMAAVSEKHGEHVGGEVTQWGAISKGYTHFANGDVLIAKITPCFENGKAARVTGLKHGIGAGSTEFHVFRPITEGVNPAYIYLFLRSPLFRIKGHSSMTGTAGQKRLPTDYFALCTLPLPPKEEQARIVAKVDELMDLCDQLERDQQDRRKLQNVLRQSTLRALASAESPHELQKSWQRLQANFGCLFSEPGDVRELRATCVELAIRGVMTPATDHESLVNASQLLDHLASVKSGKRSAKAIPVDPPFDLPTTWCWARFDDLLDGSESGWSPKCDAEPRRPGEWGVLKVSAVTWGEFRPDENKRLPPSLDHRPECEVKPGDFLLSRANTAELVARSVITADGVPDRLMMSDKIVRLRFIDPELKPWANLVNNSLFSREYYRSNATGTSDSMRNVSRQVIHDLPIPLPPKHVQDAVMRKLTDLNRFCDSLEEQLKHAALNAERLAASSVATFTGITIEQGEETAVKAPQTELIAPLRLGIAPDVRGQAPLATLLARHNGEMSARDLWQRFGGEIDAFYAQLKTEVAHGWITEPPVAEVRAKLAETAGG